MKKIYVSSVALIFFALSASLLTSCKKDFFKPTSTTNLTEEAVFTDSARTVGFMAGIYSDVAVSFKLNRFGAQGGLEVASDEAETANLGAATNIGFATGTINPYLVSADVFNICYAKIRSVNNIIHNVSKSPINQGMKDQMVAEARFLRAWYYFILLKHYGGVPIVGDSLYNYTDKLVTRRANFEDLVNYIAKDCEEAAKVLPVIQSGQGLGRASGAACSALRARLYLYAASPLFNGENPNDAGGQLIDKEIAGDLKHIIGYPTKDVNRWQEALKYAKQVISGGYFTLEEDNSTPGKGFGYMWGKRDSKEFIFQWMMDDNTYVEDLFYPPSRSGRNGSFPYQNLVDAFPTIDGKDITDPTSGYDPKHPYNNRDPRLAWTVVRDSSLVNWRTENGFREAPRPIKIFVLPNGADNGTDTYPNGTRTGYYAAKMLDPNAVPATIWATTKRCIPLIRYAEILLIAAEAENELGNPAEAVKYLKTIRNRAGIKPGADGNYGMPDQPGQAKVKELIQKERRIEFAFEEQRHWDVRRWLIADVTDNFQAKGMKVTRTSMESPATYEIVNIRRHSFKKALYLWPFPQSEINKNKDMLQNPGY